MYLYASSSDLSGVDAPASPGTVDIALFLSSIFFSLRSLSFFLERSKEFNAVFVGIIISFCSS